MWNRSRGFLQLMGRNLMTVSLSRVSVNFIRTSHFQSDCSVSCPSCYQHVGRPTWPTRPLWCSPTVSCCSLVFKQSTKFNPTANRLKFLFIIILHKTSILTNWCCFFFIATRCVGDQSQQPREEAAAQEGQGPRGLWGPGRGGGSKDPRGGTCGLSDYQYQEEQRKQWYI